jgi:hypothetical protein
MPTSANGGPFIAATFFLGSDDLAKNLAKELDPTFDVTVGGSVDGEAVYPLDPPARENLSNLVRVADDHL